MPKPFEAVYTITDASGDDASHSISIPTSFTLAQVTEFIRSMAVLVNNIIGGVITNGTLTVKADLSGLTGNTVASTADVEEKGSFQFLTADGYPVDVNVPCIIETLEASGSDNLNQVDANVAAFITAMEDGISTAGGTIQPSDRAEDDIVATVYARSIIQNSGKRR